MNSQKRLTEKIELEFEKQFSRTNMALNVCHACLARIGNREIRISTRRDEKANFEVGIALARSPSLP